MNHKLLYLLLSFTLFVTACESIQLELTDNKAPIISITSPKADALITTSAVTVEGSSIDDIEVTKLSYMLNGNDPVDVFDSLSGTKFSFTVDFTTADALAVLTDDGIYKIQVVAEDAVGNSAIAAIQVILDNTLPELNITSPVNDAVVNSQMITVTGTAKDSEGIAILQYQVDDSVAQDVSSSFDGEAFSFNVNLGSKGKKTIKITATDSAGNRQSQSVSVSMDEGLPVIELNNAEQSIITKNNAMTISGKVEDDNLAKLWYKLDDAETVDITEMLIDKSFSFELTFQSEGTKKLILIAEDSTGNQATVIIDISYDQSKPSLVILSPKEGQTFSKEEITISGTVTDNLGISGFSYKLNGGEKQPLKHTIKQGSFSFKVKLDKSKTNQQLEFTVGDYAGHAIEQTLSLTLDKNAPQISITSHQNDDTVTNSSITLEGTVTDNSGIRELSYSQNNGHFTNISSKLKDGKFVLQLSFTQEGEQTITFRAKDTQGLESSKTIKLQFVNTAIIEGYVYEDLDADGQKDNHEQGFEGRTVYLDINNNNLWDQGEQGVTTNDQGKYRFSGLSAGNYTVKQVLPDNERQASGGKVYQSLQSSNTAIKLNGLKSQNLESIDTPMPNIVNGNDASIEMYGFQVSLTLAAEGEHYHFCGGTLISDQWVLTAAHCVDDPTRIASAYIIAGSGSRKLVFDDRFAAWDGTGQLIKIQEAYLHPDYYTSDDPFATLSDVAVLKLAEPVTFTDTVYTIEPLSPEQAELAATDTLATAIGWGNLYSRLFPPDPLPGPISPEQLQEAHMPIVDQELCKEQRAIFGTPIDNSIICTASQSTQLSEDDTGSVSACPGDSGGALLVPNQDRTAWRQAGVFSFMSRDCTSIYPNGWARVSHLYDWIKEASKDYSNYYDLQLGHNSIEKNVNFGNIVSKRPLVKTIEPRVQLESFTPSFGIFANTTQDNTFNWYITAEADNFECIFDPDGPAGMPAVNVPCQAGQNSYTTAPYPEAKSYQATLDVKNNQMNQNRKLNFDAIAFSSDIKGEISPDDYNNEFDRYSDYFRLTGVTDLANLQLYFLTDNSAQALLFNKDLFDGELAGLMGFTTPADGVFDYTTLQKLFLFDPTPHPDGEYLIQVNPSNFIDPFANYTLVSTQGNLSETSWP